MAFVFPGMGMPDYSTCRYGSSKILFRGPRCDLSRPYCAFLGGTATVGKFVPEAFPTLIESRLGIGAVNLGCINAGIDVFLNETAIAEVASGASVSVVQIIGAQNISNRFYSVHPRRNDRFVHPSQALLSLYRDVDFTEFHFTKHLVGALARRSPERFEILLSELRSAWVSRMKLLLSRLASKTLLLWVSNHPPPKQGQDGLSLQRDPPLVTMQMLDQVRPYADGYVEVVGSPEAQLMGLRGMAFAEPDRPAAAEVLGPSVHCEVAQALAPVLRAMI